jgi:large subunit ribosomal protein L19
MQLIEKIEGEQIKKHVPFRVGDSVKVHTRVREGDKERTQIFAGVVIAHKGRGLNESFTVRRISYGEGVERVFPLNSPRIEKIEVEREGQVRRAKLFYLRGRKGKEALFVKERVKATVAKKEKASAARKAKAEKEAAAKK